MIRSMPPPIGDMPGHNAYLLHFTTTIYHFNKIFIYFKYIGYIYYIKILYKKIYIHPHMELYNTESGWLGISAIMQIQDKARPFL